MELKKRKEKIDDKYEHNLFPTDLCPVRVQELTFLQELLAARQYIHIKIFGLTISVVNRIKVILVLSSLYR